MAINKTERLVQHLALYRPELQYMSFRSWMDIDLLHILGKLVRILLSFLRTLYNELMP